ncbi:hypothetical protein [Fictibacillus phosphorivorans]|uniref:hypothetical protein n=1 Tax=Fictibacillus phosphorivorans TaxID=1221500 RepID=UPI00203E652B|nr:hypothetical protein [Fictibacillus phosphorivorans]MCM3719179.1 hypothetical protein [Fictibacillus phosphorivorans]MCM3776801.1 hypothetical protein [Fictibacillus phosphorivorans]
MQLNTYKSFGDLVNTGHLSSDVNYYFSTALRTLDDLLVEEEIKHFYVKNPFSSELNNMEMIIFLDQTIFIINLTKDSTNITSVKLNKVDKVELCVKETEFREVVLTIHINGEKPLILNSLEDSNHNRNPKYAENIKKIFKFLS